MDDEVRRMADYYHSEERPSFEDVANEFHTYAGRVRRLFKENGIPRRDPHEGKRGKKYRVANDAIDSATPEPTANIVRPSVRRMMR